VQIDANRPITAAGKSLQLRQTDREDRFFAISVRSIPSRR